MAWILTQPLSAEHGVSPGVIQTLKDAGALPDVPQYVKIGGVLFPAPRRLRILWQVYPSKAAYLAHAANPQPDTEPRTVVWEILPEPNVIRREQRDPKSQEVLQPALVLPSFDQVMAVGDSATVLNNAELWDLARALLYEMSAAWPDFAGAELDD
jgi:hypothetical protein